MATNDRRLANAPNPTQAGIQPIQNYNGLPLAFQGLGPIQNYNNLPASLQGIKINQYANNGNGGYAPGGLSGLQPSRKGGLSVTPSGGGSGNVIDTNVITSSQSGKVSGKSGSSSAVSSSKAAVAARRDTGGGGFQRGQDVVDDMGRVLQTVQPTGKPLGKSTYVMFPVNKKSTNYSRGPDVTSSTGEKFQTVQKEGSLLSDSYVLFPEARYSELLEVKPTNTRTVRSETVIPGLANTQFSVINPPTGLGLMQTSGEVPEYLKKKPLGQGMISKAEPVKFAFSGTPILGGLFNFFGKTAQKVEEPIYEVGRNQPKGFWDTQALFGAGVASGMLRTPQGLVDLGYNAATNPVATAISLPGALGQSLAKVRYGGAFEGGEFAGQLIATKGISKGLGLTGTLVKNTYIAAGAKKIPVENLAKSETILGTEPMPLSKGISDSMRQFFGGKTSRGTIKVTTASPQALTGTNIGLFGKAAAGLEDPGLYVSPAGKTSLYFTGVKPLSSEYSISLNPLSGLSRKVPTITNLEVSNVLRYPRSVIKQPGFAELGEFQTDILAPKAAAVITKRSEIGLGEIRPQLFRATADFKSDGGLDILKGELRREAGTSEVEAVVPIGSVFEYGKLNSWLARRKGFEFYTSWSGKNIAIREATVKGAGSGSIFGPGTGTITGKSIFAETKALSSILNPTKKITPSYSNFLTLSKPTTIMSSSPKYAAPSVISDMGTSMKSLASSTSSVISKGGGSLFSTKYRTSRVSRTSRISSRSGVSGGGSSILGGSGLSGLIGGGSGISGGKSGGSGLSRGGSGRSGGRSTLYLPPRLPLKPTSPLNVVMPSLKGKFDLLGSTKKLPGRKYGYTPSFTSNIFGYYGKKPKQKVFTGQEGFGRPLLRSKIDFGFGSGKKKGRRNRGGFMNMGLI